jgi:AcrR family transcriptional regulator
VTRNADRRERKATRSGRPRDPSRDDAIRTAALDLLGEVAYEGVTVRAIAERAGVSLATMYRRWPTKEDLVIDAVASYSDPTERMRPGDDPRQNLVALASGIRDLLAGERRGLVPTIVGQLPYNPTLAETLRTRIIRPRLAVVVEQVRSLPGADPDRVEEAAEMLAATLFFRTLVSGHPVSDDDLRRLVDTVTTLATSPAGSSDRKRSARD